jgi:hypothetical protein
LGAAVSGVLLPVSNELVAESIVDSTPIVSSSSSSSNATSSNTTSSSNATSSTSATTTSKATTTATTSEATAMAEDVVVRGVDSNENQWPALAPWLGARGRRRCVQSIEREHVAWQQLATAGDCVRLVESPHPYLPNTDLDFTVEIVNFFFIHGLFL